MDVHEICDTATMAAVVFPIRDTTQLLSLSFTQAVVKKPLRVWLCYNPFKDDQHPVPMSDDQRRIFLHNGTLSDCLWFTFFPHIGYCELFHNCSTLDTQFCSDCITGEVRRAAG